MENRLQNLKILNIRYSFCLKIKLTQFYFFKVGIASTNTVPINARFEPEKTPEPVPIIEFTGFKRKTDNNLFDKIPILPVQPVSRIETVLLPEPEINDKKNQLKEAEEIKESQVKI